MTNLHIFLWLNWSLMLTWIFEAMIKLVEEKGMVLGSIVWIIQNKMNWNETWLNVHFILFKKFFSLYLLLGYMGWNWTFPHSIIKLFKQWLEVSLNSSIPFHSSSYIQISLHKHSIISMLVEVLLSKTNI